MNPKTDNCFPEADDAIWRDLQAGYGAVGEKRHGLYHPTCGKGAYQALSPEKRCPESSIPVEVGALLRTRSPTPENEATT